jgi:hypothetical protein
MCHLMYVYLFFKKEKNKEVHAKPTCDLRQKWCDIISELRSSMVSHFIIVANYHCTLKRRTKT